MPEYLPRQKLWKLTKEPDGYYYELRLAGMVVDRFRVPKDSKLNLVMELK